MVQLKVGFAVIRVDWKRNRIERVSYPEFVTGSGETEAAAEDDAMKKAQVVASSYGPECDPDDYFW